MNPVAEERIKHKKSSVVVNAACFTLPAMLVFLLTEPAISGAGDLNIAGHLASSKISPGFFFISPVLAGFLRMLHKVIRANWWVVFSIAVMFTGLFVFLWFLNKRNHQESKESRIFLMVLFVLFFWEAILKWEINFTQTAVIAGLSGILLIVDSCYEREQQKVTAPKVLAGIGFLFLAGSVRWKALLLMLPFGIMCLLYLFTMPLVLSDLATSLKESFAHKRRVLNLAVLIIFIVAASDGIHKVYGIIDPVLGEYVEANALREEICDYPERYPRYEEAESVYKELGITPSWINMVNNFLTGDMNYFSSQDLRKMVDLKQDSKATLRDFAGSLMGHGLLWISIALLVGYIGFLKGIRKIILPLTGCIFAFTACAVYFVHIGRFAWRVTNGCIVACVVSFVVMSVHMGAARIPARNAAYERYLAMALSVMFCLVWGMAIKTEKGRFTLPVAETINEQQAAVLEHINEKSDILYVGADQTLQFYRTYNIWTSHEAEYLQNLVFLNAHFITGERTQLANVGVQNLFDDMLERADILVKYAPLRNAVIYGYIRDYYDPCVTMTVVDSCEEARFLRYTRPIRAEVMKEQGNTVVDVAVKKIDEFPADQTIKTAIRVRADIGRGGVQRLLYSCKGL